MITYKKISLGFIVLLLSGCQSNTLYNWNNYDEGMYNYYHDPVASKEFPVTIIEHVKEVELQGQKPAPGLCAEAGTFLLNSGNISQAIELYKKEATYWPESKPLMDTLINNLSKRI
ncbi:DUF4810 domain-containing protein [Photobacterium nomapromontoriensis]|uniref:DUF4810 domain-containing protein n=1 Tax=Photobacterium nomapromontoriensis TaxID=2910237 RepID=UPI003D10300C